MSVTILLIRSYLHKTDELMFSKLCQLIEMIKCNDQWGTAKHYHIVQ